MSTQKAGSFAAMLGAIALAGAPDLMAQAARGDEVTFARDIAPILQRSCQGCHRPDSLAPMSLITDEDVRPYARAIKQRTGLRNRQGVMPPSAGERRRFPRATRGMCARRSTRQVST